MQFGQRHAFASAAILTQRSLAHQQSSFRSQVNEALQRMQWASIMAIIMFVWKKIKRDIPLVFGIRVSRNRRVASCRRNKATAPTWRILPRRDALGVYLV